MMIKDCVNSETVDFKYSNKYLSLKTEKSLFIRLVQLKEVKELGNIK